jgi:glycosyltransferase involved in cell wall biosynthesis
LAKNDKGRIFLKILWISSVILDLDTHISKTSRIEISRHLAKRGHDVYFIAARSRKRYYSENSQIRIIPIPLRYVPIISPMFYGLVVFFFFPFYVIWKRPDFILTDPQTSVFSFLWKPLLCQFIKTRVILDIRSTPVAAFGFRGFLYKLQFNISVQLAKKLFDGITIITPTMKEEVCNAFNIDSKSIGLWSDAASTELFTYEKNIAYGFELREKLGLSNKFTLFYHGSIGKSRGIVECIEAVAILKKKYPDVVLFILGGGRDIGLLKNAIREFGVEDAVVMHGAVNYEDVPKYIAMSDIGLVPLPDIPDWRNQCPLKLLEYLAMKRTVILTDIPANRNIVGQEKCGIYVPSCDPAEIAKAMEFAYKNRKKLEEWGKSGRKIIEQEYNWDKKAKDLEDYLLKIRG